MCKKSNIVRGIVLCVVLVLALAAASGAWAAPQEGWYKENFNAAPWANFFAPNSRNPAAVRLTTPVEVPGNPACGAGLSEFKLERARLKNGTYTDGYLTVTISNIDVEGGCFDWSSNVGVDNVIVKGGPTANVYSYSPESTGDTGLCTPINPNNNKHYAISHISFCYDIEAYALQVSKTVHTSFTRTWQWTIDKSVTPEVWRLFRSDSGTSRYTVSVVKSGPTDSGWAVEGTITIYNPAPVAATITGVSDEISGFGAATVNCSVSFPYTLGPGQMLQCTYSASLPNASTRTNTATVTTSGEVNGGTATATVDFSNATMTEVNGTIHVDDTNGGSWEFSDSGSVSYSKTFTCDDDTGSHSNTATIRETQQSDSATVTVYCYALEVRKDAQTSYRRTYHWTIDKLVTPEVWHLFRGDSGTSRYQICVEQTGYTDSGPMVSGNIYVYNPAPIPATINSLSDLVSPDIVATVNCSVSFPYTLGPGETLHCTYSASLPDASTRTNTATATLQNYDYNYDGGKSAAGTTDFSGSATVDFSNATVEEVNKTIHVNDSNGGSWAFSESGCVSYDVTFSCDSDAGPHPNTATIVETGQSDSTSVMVYCYALQVTKDAQTSLRRTYHWTIDKSVTPEVWHLFRGDSGTSLYTVSVVKTGYTDSDWAVSGNIAVYNPAPIPATINSLSDIVSGVGSANVVCSVSFPYTLGPGETLHCTYSASLPDDSTRTNTATATLQNYNYDYLLNATPAGTTNFSGSATVDFSNATMTEVNGTIHVDDTNGGSWEFSDSGSVSYSKTFTCDDDAGSHSNIATIRETQQFDSASVMVYCYALQVTKDAQTSFKRTYYWTIDKWADQSMLSLCYEPRFLVNYSVKVDATYTDSDWAVSGNIAVYNPAPIPATINSLSDIVSGVGSANVVCSVSFPYTLGPGETLHCTYSASLPDDSTRTNTATATLQNYDYDYEMNATPAGTTDFSGSATVDFSNATMIEVDECIDVSDTYAGALGTVCYPDVPQTFTYSRWIGPYEECGEYTVQNTASFVTNDTGASGSDSWTVNITIPCGLIGDWVWHDGNQDKAQDPWELGLANITVCLRDRYFNLIACTETDAYGYYEFRCLDVRGEKGEYWVQVDESDPHLPHGAFLTTANNPKPVVLTCDRPEYREADFGFAWWTPVVLGSKFHDVDNIGQKDPDEPLLGGWTIIIRDAAGREVYRTQTIADESSPLFGKWLLTIPLVGEHTIEEVPQEGWIQTYPDTNNGIYRVHFNHDGTYSLLSPAPTGFEGLDFGNAMPLLGCPACVDEVIFQSDRDGNWEIYQMKNDGTEQTRLTFNDADDTAPTWHPTGFWVFFQSFRDENWEIYRMNRDGSAQVNLTENPATDIAPSAGCPWVAFQSDRDGNWEIYRMNLDGTDVTRLTFYEEATDAQPAWDADCRTIAFQSDRDGNWEIYRMDYEGNNLVRLTYNDADDVRPVWSWDGQWIAFQSNRGGEWDIWVMDVNGENVTNITNFEASDKAPAWFPSCEWIFFQSDRDEPGNWDIYRTNQAGTIIERLTYGPHADLIENGGMSLAQIVTYSQGLEKQDITSK